MTDETNTIDLLMSLDPLSMTAEDIDGIIAHHRRNRALAASGQKPVKESGPKVSLDQVLGKLIPKAPVVKGLRRI